MPVEGSLRVFLPPPGPAVRRIVGLRGEALYGRCARAGLDASSCVYQLLTLGVLYPDLTGWQLTELALARARRAAD